MSSRLDAVRWKAVIVGVLGGSALGLILGVIPAVVFHHELAASGSAGAALRSSDRLLLACLAVALSSSFAGGWIGARLAPGFEIANALAVGTTTLVLSALLFVPLGMGDYPLSYNVPAFLLTVPGCWLGGISRLISKRRKSAPHEQRRGRWS